MTPRPTSPEMDISSPLIDSVVAESTTLSTDPLSTSTESQPSLIGNAPNPSSQLLCTSNTDPENPFYPQLSAESTASDMIVRPSGTMFHEDGVITIPQNAVKLQNPRRHVIYDGQGLRQDRSRSRDIFSSGVGYNASIPVDPPPAHGGDKDPRLLLDGIRQSPDVTQKQTRRRYLPARIGISTISYNPTCDANGAPLYETFHSMGIRYSSMMYYENAREYFYKALAKIESTERTCGSHTNLRLKCACLINLSSMYMNKRNHEKARELTELALDGFKVTIKETDLKLFATAQMGSISLSVGDYETALKYLNEALHGYRMFFWDDIYSDGPIAMLLEWLGKIYYIQGNFDRALELYRHIAWRYKRSICSCTPRRLRGILENGEICEEMKDNETALLFYELALVGWGLLQDPSLENHPDKLWTLHNLGTFYRKQGDYEKALDYSTQVVEGLRLNDDRANQGFGYTPESYLGEFCYSSSASIDDETPLMND
jgi:tetratricopeptide (TPR) repeat protein